MLINPLQALRRLATDFKVFLELNMLEPPAYLNGSTTGYKRQLLIDAVTLRGQRDIVQGSVRGVAFALADNCLAENQEEEYV